MGVWLGQGGWYVRRGLGWAGEWEVAGLSLHSSVLALPIHQWGNHPVSRGRWVIRVMFTGFVLSASEGGVSDMTF